MSPIYNQLLIPYIIAMILAITMGGSGTAPAFSASYGANVIRKSLIPGIFGIAVFLGAFVAGKHTASTMGNGILSSDYMTFSVVSIALFSVAITLLIANISGIPQSTSQAAVLAIAAPALYFNRLDTGKLFLEIIPAWFILPIISYFLSYLCGKYIYKPMRRPRRRHAHRLGRCAAPPAGRRAGSAGPGPAGRAGLEPAAADGCCVLPTSQPLPACHPRPRRGARRAGACRQGPRGNPQPGSPGHGPGLRQAHQPV